MGERQAAAGKSLPIGSPLQLVRHHIRTPQREKFPDDVLQLTDIAWPGMGHEGLSQGRANLNLGVSGAGMFLDKELRQGENLFSPVAQRRNLDADDVEPVI